MALERDLRFITYRPNRGKHHARFGPSQCGMLWSLFHGTLLYYQPNDKYRVLPCLSLSEDLFTSRIAIAPHTAITTLYTTCHRPTTASTTEAASGISNGVTERECGCEDCDGQGSGLGAHEPGTQPLMYLEWWNNKEVRYGTHTCGNNAA
jgi:hypothetical protein